MSNNFDSIDHRLSRLAGVMCVPAAVLFGLITLALIGVMVNKGDAEEDGMPMWVAAVVCGSLAFASGFVAVRLWSGGPGGGGAARVPVVTPTDSPGPHFNLVILNDNTHSYDYVIRLLNREFGMSVEKAFALARAIDQTGRAVVFIGDAVEVQERMTRVLAAGPDPLLKISTGPLHVLVEEVVSA